MAVHISNVNNFCNSPTLDMLFTCSNVITLVSFFHTMEDRWLLGLVHICKHLFNETWLGTPGLNHVSQNSNLKPSGSTCGTAPTINNKTILNNNIHDAIFFLPNSNQANSLSVSPVQQGYEMLRHRNNCDWMPFLSSPKTFMRFEPRTCLLQAQCSNH